MGHTQKTEREERIEKAKAIQAIKFGTVEVGSLAYWHYLTIKEEGK